MSDAYTDNFAKKVPSKVSESSQFAHGTTGNCG